jgi:N-formylmaleamate deformylase
MTGNVTISGRPALVQASGLTHRVLLYGEHADRDLLLVPGITSPAACADFLAVELAALGFRVAVPDVRGRGGSDVPPAGHYTLKHYAGDVAALVEALGFQRPVLIGHSMGARIVTAYAVDAGASEHAQVILVDPPISGPGRPAYPTTKAQFLEQLAEARRGTTADEVRRFYPHWPERELRIRAEVLASCDETAVLETHEGFESEDFHSLYRNLSLPSVVIRGAQSAVLPPEEAEELRALRPDIPVIDVPGAGHMVPWDNFAGFLDALVQYLKQGPAREPGNAPAHLPQPPSAN